MNRSFMAPLLIASALGAGALIGWVGSGLADQPAIPLTPALDTESAPPGAPAATPVPDEPVGIEREPNGNGEPVVSGAPDPLPLEALRTFAEVFERIKQDYVEPVDDQALIEAAIRGMLGGLDPHSSYLSTEEYRDLQVGTRGEFGGLGIEVGIEDGFVKVIAPIDDTPAQRAGLLAGDTILRIDQKPVKGLSLNEAVNLMRGRPGTRIQLTIMRGSGEPPFEVEIERAVIQVASVRHRMLEPGFGYVRVAHFQSRTVDDLAAAVGTLKDEAGGALKGLVLDLRNNPGGVLNSAVGVSDAFLPEGLIVYTKGRLAESQMRFSAGADDLLDGAPLVVLVNGGSASASEIVAGALQDHRRAIVMGRPTFGKGSVQTIVPVDEETALKLTTARYYTPSGRSIQAQGIVPDIVLEAGEFRPQQEASIQRVRESDLLRHLGDEDELPPGDRPAEPSPQPLALEDFQLAEALNVLKGIAILGQPANVNRARADAVEPSAD